MSLAFLLASQFAAGQMMVPDTLPKALWGAWDLSENDCLNSESSTRVEFGPNWMRDNLGSGKLEFFTTVAPMTNYGVAIEARFILGGIGGLRDQQMLLNLRESEGDSTLLWVDSSGPGHIDDTIQPIELFACRERES